MHYADQQREQHSNSHADMRHCRILHERYAHVQVMFAIKEQQQDVIDYELSTWCRTAMLTVASSGFPFRFPPFRWT